MRVRRPSGVPRSSFRPVAFDEPSSVKWASDDTGPAQRAAWPRPNARDTRRLATSRRDATSGFCPAGSGMGAYDLACPRPGTYRERAGPWRTGRRRLCSPASRPSSSSAAAAAGYPLITGDDLTQNYPLEELSGQILRHGHLPLWDAFLWSGTPLLGGTNAHALLPITLAVRRHAPAGGMDARRGRRTGGGGYRVPAVPAADGLRDAGALRWRGQASGWEVSSARRSSTSTSQLPPPHCPGRSSPCTGWRRGPAARPPAALPPAGGRRSMDLPVRQPRHRHRRGSSSAARYLVHLWLQPLDPERRADRTAPAGALDGRAARRSGSPSERCSGCRRHSSWLSPSVPIRASRSSPAARSTARTSSSSSCRTSSAAARSAHGPSAGTSPSPRSTPIQASSPWSPSS